MTVFETDSRVAFTSGVIVLAVIFLSIAALAIGMIALPLTVLTVVMAALVLALIALAIWTAYRLNSLLHCSYAVDRNAFVIRFGATRHIVPMANIKTVIRGSDIIGAVTLRRAPLNGWWFGRGQHPSLGNVYYYATSAPEDQFVLVTESDSFVVSPFDTETFAEAFAGLQANTPSQAVQPSLLQPNYQTWQLWKDKAAWVLLILGLGINLVVFGISAGRYPTAPAQISLHFNANGLPDRFGTSNQLFLPPLFGLAIFIANAAVGMYLYRRGEGLASYLLWGGSAAVQVCFLIAAVTIGFSNGA